MNVFYLSLSIYFYLYLLSRFTDSSDLNLPICRRIFASSGTMHRCIFIWVIFFIRNIKIFYMRQGLSAARNILRKCVNQWLKRAGTRTMPMSESKSQSANYLIILDESDLSILLQQLILSAQRRVFAWLMYRFISGVWFNLVSRWIMELVRFDCNPPCT